MNHFFRSFFAALLALVVFNLAMLVLGLLAVAAFSAGRKVSTGDHAVLVVDLSDNFTEAEPAGSFVALLKNGREPAPSLHHLLQLIRYAREDGSVEGIYLKCGVNNNGLAACEEIRDALLDFRKGGKFVYAYGNVLSQKAYYIASAADKVYCHPAGGIEWHGLSMQMPFITGMLEKLDIRPQIFYAGKFKSSTEIFREKKMTLPNRQQNIELLSEIYAHMLLKVSGSRHVDTASLRRYADSNSVHFPSAALAFKMVDGLRYDDEVKNELKKRLKTAKTSDLNFISSGRYAEAVNFRKKGEEKIAVIYAEGNIIDGEAPRGMIGGDTYRNYIRKAREDESVKAVVLRINSGGGSAMASEVIWREVALAREAKPVFVSFGDVAASGGYYMACGADHIFTEANTITGSIGVYGIIPNLENFFSDKIGITFDGVETSPDAGMMTVVRPLSPMQRRYMQQEIDTVYRRFLFRVAEGRKRPAEYIDSIAQGRIWTGTTAVKLGLADTIGSLKDAIGAAAKKTGLKSYGIQEYPGRPDILEMILGNGKEAVKESAIREEIGPEAYATYSAVRQLQQDMGRVQARLPFGIIID